GWQGGGGGRRAAQLLDTAPVGVAQQKDDAPGMDEPDVRERVGFFLPALASRLCRRGWGADDAPCGAVMGTRGDGGPATGAAAGRGSAGGTLPAAASATPSRGARAVRDRAGAAPRVRRAARSTGKSPCSHGWALPWPSPTKRPCTTWR